MMPRVLVIGSINVDYVIETDRIPALGETLTGRGFSMNLGGKGANQAIALAKQGCEVKMLGAVGRDGAGSFALENLCSYGVDCTEVLSVDAPTGAAVITVCKGDNHIILDEGANACVTPEVVAAHESLLAWADAVVMQYEIPIESVLAAARMAKKHGKRVLLNPAPVKEVPAELYGFVDWIVPNEFETELITGVFPADDKSAEAGLRALLARGAQNAIITLGKRGSAYTYGENVGFFGTYPVVACDSTAAGDSFLGGFCARLCMGDTPADAVAYASAVSAIAVSRAGAARSIPTKDEVLAFLAKQKKEKENLQ